MSKIQDNLLEIDEYSDRINIDLMYPRIRMTKKLTLGISDVRAASSIYISYDYERDGYRIGMDATKDDDGMLDVLEEDVEVAFIPAWNEPDNV